MTKWPNWPAASTRHPLAAVERRVVFGLNGAGRWIAPTVSHDEAGKTFGVKAVSVESYPWGTDYYHP